jgi:hypothetical protein
MHMLVLIYVMSASIPDKEPLRAVADATGEDTGRGRIRGEILYIYIYMYIYIYIHIDI